MSELFRNVDWTTIVGVFNFSAVGVLIGVLVALHKKHAELLSNLRQLEFVKEIQAFRQFYEEKRLILEDQYQRKKKGVEKQLAESQDQVQKAQGQLEAVLTDLKLSKSENDRLVAALESAMSATQLQLYRSFHHEVGAELAYALLKTDHLLHRTSDRVLKDRLDPIALILRQAQFKLKKGFLFFTEDHPIRTENRAVISESLERVRSVVGFSANLKNVRLEFSELFEKLPPVEFTDDLLDLVLFEALNNAVKFAEKNTTIRVDADVQDKSWLCFSVFNKCSPLTAIELDRIFQRGYRTETTRIYCPVGSGMGLWIIRRSLESYGGTAKAEWINGTFHLTLTFKL